MPLRPVPWALSGGADGRGGAENLVELARAGTYVGSSGATGIVEPGDLRVKALPVPGAAVRVVSGTAVIKSLYPGVFGQSYVVQEQSYTDVPVEATGSAAALKKYVYIMIEDTQYKGQVPEDEATGPYNSYQVTTDLPTFTPYILLAEINQPKSTATITNGMITDRRKVANPRVLEVPVPRPIVTGDAGLELKSRSPFPDGEWFPNAGGNDNTGRYDIEVPEWASYMHIRCEWLSVGYKGNPGAGGFWVSFGPDGGSNNPTWYTQFFGWNSGDGTTVMPWICEDTARVRPEWRGTILSFFPRANKTTGTEYKGSVHLSPRSGMVFKVRFTQIPDVDFQ